MIALDEIEEMPVKARIIGILWISFLMASAATAVFFILIDPFALEPCIPNFPQASRLGAYTIGFMMFWCLTASSSLTSHFLLRSNRT